jgi:hypothetical protein
MVGRKANVAVHNTCCLAPTALSYGANMYKFLGKNNATNVILQGDITFNLTYSAMHKHTVSVLPSYH